MRAETWLRFALPALFATFLICLGAVAAMLLQAQREEVIRAATTDVEAVTRLAAAAFAGVDIDGEAKGEAAHRNLGALLPPGLLHAGRQILLISPNDVIVAANPPLPGPRRTLTQHLGEMQALSTLGESAGVMTVTLADGSVVIAALRNLPGGRGQVAVLQPLTDITAAWTTRMRNQAILLGAAALVIIGTGIAYALQTRRAYAVDRVCEEIKQRLDTALGRGRCGLWDWDIPRGRIYWSDSMY
ncbi:MAG: PAS domain-containing sensor histidine kinase, partial [Methylobacterium sp.]